MSRPLAALLALTVFSTALAEWTPTGRQVERSSTSRSDTSVHFTLLPGEDPVHAALDCLKATRAAYQTATWVDCMAYTPGGFAKRSGKIRPCYSTIARWFADDGGMIRLYFAADDRTYPKGCPAVEGGP